MESEIAKALSLLGGVALGLYTLWKFFSQMRNEIEAPLLRRIHYLEGRLEACLQARADDAMTTAWNGIERRGEHD